MIDDPRRAKLTFLQTGRHYFGFVSETGRYAEVEVHCEKYCRGLYYIGAAGAEFFRADERRAGKKPASSAH